MLRVIWAFWLISGTWLQTVSAEALSPGVEIRGSQAFFDESFLDLQEELDLAKEEGKIGILIMFEIDDCPFCYRMKHTVLNRSDIQDYFHSYFRILSINTEARLEMTDFSGEVLTLKDFSLKRNRVRATPVFQFYDRSCQADWIHFHCHQIESHLKKHYIQVAHVALKIQHKPFLEITRYQLMWEK